MFACKMRDKDANKDNDGFYRNKRNTLVGLQNLICQNMHFLKKINFWLVIVSHNSTEWQI